jgi:hypothetical protein
MKFNLPEAFLFCDRNLTNVFCDSLLIFYIITARDLKVFVYIQSNAWTKYVPIKGNITQHHSGST